MSEKGEIQDNSKEIERLSKEFSKSMRDERNAFRKFNKNEEKRYQGGLDNYDHFVKDLNKWYETKLKRLAILKEALGVMGLNEQPKDGQVRLFRGVLWPWDTKKVLPNSYWIEDPEFALDFARNGDLVVLDVDEKDVYRVKDPEKEGEIQLPNPELANKAILIIRNGQFVDNKRPPTPNIMNLLRSIIKDQNSAPKNYDHLHDEYINK